MEDQAAWPGEITPARGSQRAAGIGHFLDVLRRKCTINLSRPAGRRNEHGAPPADWTARSTSSISRASRSSLRRRRRSCSSGAVLLLVFTHDGNTSAEPVGDGACGTFRGRIRASILALPLDTELPRFAEDAASATGCRFADTGAAAAARAGITDDAAPAAIVRIVPEIGAPARAEGRIVPAALSLDAGRSIPGTRFAAEAAGFIARFQKQSPLQSWKPSLHWKPHWKSPSTGVQVGPAFSLPGHSRH